VPSGTVYEKNMANTYTQIHIQVIFAVQNRHCLIQKQWKKELYQYISGVIQNNGHKLLQINGMPDHIHILLGFRPSQSLSNLMKMVKHDSSGWINQKHFIVDRFSWQSGYGAFSYSKSQLPTVIRYIQNQEQHHKKKTFIEEYLELLKRNEIDYNEKYIFKPVI
jgi:REP element-mobilizing transposase RayT